MTERNIFAPVKHQDITKTALMQTEIKKAIREVKKQLPPTGAYKQIVTRSKGKVSLDQVKKVFSFGTASETTIEQVLIFGKKVADARKGRIERLKNLHR